MPTDCAITKGAPIDAGKIEAAITPRTRCLMLVHLGGAAANLDVILPLAQKRRLPVIEDTCQSHFAEWRGRKLGTLGDVGCFSFQGSKNLNAGEGSALVGNNAALMEICQSFHNQGRPTKVSNFSYVRNGDNRRLTEFQGALLLAQLTRLKEQSRLREQNAQYLTQQLREVPGIKPARMYEGCTRNAYHICFVTTGPASASCPARVSSRRYRLKAFLARPATHRSVKSHSCSAPCSRALTSASTRKKRLPISPRVIIARRMINSAQKPSG